MAAADDGMITVPSDFGDFYLEKELGHGGMGGVYLGRDKMLDRPEAIKVMLPSMGSDPSFVEKFQKEAQAAAKLQHPNIAQIHRFGIEQGRPYIAMEVCKGGSLDGDMEKNPGRLDVVRVMRIGEQLASALSIAAEAGIVHGDVKPENVLYDNDGNAKLVDFGLAAMQADSNEIWGTPYYISPEKCQKKKIDFRADIYSLGGTLYHALTGVPPFDGEDAVQVVKARFKGPPRKPSEVRPDIPPEVDAIIMRMLEVEPSRRHPTYQSLLGDFKRYLAKYPQSAGGKTVGKKLTIKGRKPKLTAPVASTQQVGGTTGKLDDPNATTGAILGRFSMEPADGEEEEKEGMGALKMVLIAVLGVIASIVLLVVLLVWMSHSSTVGEEEKHLNEVVTVLNTAKKAVAANREIALEYVEKAKHRAEEAEANCRTTMTTLRGHLKTYAPELDEAFGEKLYLDPAESQVLLDAIAYTNGLAKAAAKAALPPPEPEPAPAAAPAAADGTNAVAAAAAATNAPPAAAEGAAPAAPAADGAAAPAAPAEGEAPAAEEPAQQDGEAAAEGEGEAPAEDAKPALVLPKSVQDVIALWNDAYLCRAAEIETTALVGGAIEKADSLCERARDFENRANALPTDSRNDRADLFEAAAKLYGEAGTMINEKLNEAKGRKSVTSAAGKEKQILRAARTRLPAAEETLEAAKREADHKKAVEEAAAQRQAEKEKAERERKEQAEAEIAKAKTTFDDMVGTRLRQMAWDSALKEFDRVGESIKTIEGRDELKFQRWKVEIMRDFYTHLIKFTKKHPNPENRSEELPGAELKGKNRGVTILDSTDKAFTAQAVVKDYRTGKFAPEGKPVQIEWYKLYRASSEKHRTLGVRMDWIFGKLLNALVLKGHESETNDRLRSELANSRRRSDRLLGAALTLTLLCEGVEDVGMMIKSLQEEALKAFPDNEAKIKRLFPDWTPSGEDGDDGSAGGDSGEAASGDSGDQE